MGLAVSPAAVAQLLKNPAALEPQPDPCLLEFMEGELETSYSHGNRATYEAMRAIVRKLRAWHGTARLPIRALPPVRALAFYQELLNAKARGGEIRTANKAIIHLTAMYRRGVKQLKWAAADNPFACIDKKKELKRQKVRLTAEEHRAVVALHLDPESWLWRARTVYLMQFYLRGERVGACLLLRWKDLYQNDTCLRYQAQKGGPFKQVPIRPELAAVVQSLAARRASGRTFLLPYLPDAYDKLNSTKQLDEIKKATAVINKALKEVAKRAGVDKPLRSHAARHTFATVAAKAVGARAVQQMLGHTTLKMTEVYLADLDHDEQDEAANRAFDSI
jgi:integrase